jgi:hypothetical protein
MFSTIQERNRRFSSDFDDILLTGGKMNSFLMPINMLPHDADTKCQRKRNLEDLEQVGNRE